MNFTEKEISLAKEMKLECQYNFGDIVIVANKLRLSNNVCIVIGNLNEQFGEVEIAIQHNVRHIVPVASVTWLPLWHQCRKILCDYLIELTGTANTVTLKLIRNGKQITFSGDTDLEALYRAILFQKKR